MKCEEMKQSGDNRFIPMTSVSSGKGRQLRSDVFYYTNQIVNIVMVGDPPGGKWVLVDAGMPKSAKKIIGEAAERFPDNPEPTAIVLTHGHFDHVGSIVDLIKQWQVPVYVHPEEFGFLNGRQSYPEPDTSVEGGMLAKISSIYPNQPVSISEALVPLPGDGIVPSMPGWKWIHTPGHSPGHVSLFREHDRTLIAGDAFVTVRADSFYKVLIQKEEVNGPPRYLTTDWNAAFESVKKLEALRPDLAVTGHGTAMSGEALQTGLKKLVEEFEEMAVPAYGKFVK